MTLSSATTKTSPSQTPPASEGAVVAVQLRAAGSVGEFWALAGSYLALMALAWWPAAVVAAFLLPLFCSPQHPRRVLWLWAMGLLSGGMAVMAGRRFLAGMDGVEQAIAHNPLLGGGALALVALGGAVMLWHLTWVKSPRRM